MQHRNWELSIDISRLNSIASAVPPLMSSTLCSGVTLTHGLRHCFACIMRGFCQPYRV